MNDRPALLELRGIEKRFGAIQANRGIDLTLDRGEILGLLGENGAGKTTLMNILFGLYAPDAGRILVDGRPVRIRRPADALRLGVGMVHQHFHLVPRHTVLENLMVGEPGRRGRVDWSRGRRALADLGGRYGLALEPDREVSSLSVGEQQRLEILKALFRGARVLILDEPTSVLTPQQAEGLFEALRALASGGVGIVFISHKLHEVLAVTDRVVVLRRGELRATLPNDGGLDRRSLAELMCGHELRPPQRGEHAPGRPLLRMSGVRVARRGARPALDGMALEVRAGEILGIAGVSGNGQRELAEVATGLRRADAGRLEIDGVPVEDPSPRRLQRLGVAHVPEDRVRAGVLGALPLADTMILPRAGQAPFSRWGWLHHRAVREFVDGQIRRFDIRGAAPRTRSAALSGGNMQKALLARELAFSPMVLVAAQPTRGLDVSAVEFVHSQFLRMRDERRGVLLISEDLDELAAVCDRIAVLFGGRLVGEMPARDADPARLGLMMTGGAEAA